MCLAARAFAHQALEHIGIAPHRAKLQQKDASPTQG